MFVYFYSPSFFAFLFVTLLTFWLLPAKFRRLTLLAASYIFYGSWNIYCIPIILFSTTVDYWAGIKISTESRKQVKRRFLIVSILSNISLLVFFKYMNFFVNEISESIADPVFLNIILPLGISYYTFQSMSYTIDIYREKAKVQTDFFAFALYVIYFPQLIAGPIERYNQLMPQFYKNVRFSDIEYEKAFYLIVFGLFKKIAIADQLGIYVNDVMSNPDPGTGPILWASYAFYFQIFCDFSGYTYIARGVSLLFAIQLTPNFNFPFFSQSPSDFWNRWNITLSQWVKHYLFIPLVLNINNVYLAAFISYVVMGAWHGANYTYILWGFFWFCLSILYRAPVRLPFSKLLSIITMFHFTGFGLLLFRSENLSQFWGLLLSFTQLSSNLAIPWSTYQTVACLYIFLYELLKYKLKDPLIIVKGNFYTKLVFYLSLYFIYRQALPTASMEFIYFQF